MADNFPVPEGSSKSPLPPTSGADSGGKPPPLLSENPIKKTPGGKVVVPLSSLAKQPPVLSPPEGENPAPAVLVKKAPPPLPAKRTSESRKLAMPIEAPEVKLPPKKVSVRWPTFSGTPVESILLQNENVPTTVVPKDVPPLVSESRLKPPPLPAPTTEPPKKAIVKHAPIKLNQSRIEPGEAADSIFSDNPEVSALPSGWQELQPGELDQPLGGVEGMDVFALTQRIITKPAPEPKIVVVPKIVPTPVAPVVPPPAEIKVVKPPPLPPPRAKPLVNLPPVTSDLTPTSLQPVVVLSGPLPKAEFEGLVQAPTLVPDQTAQKSLPQTIQIAPPLLVSELATQFEKLPPPQILSEGRKDETPAIAKSDDALSLKESPLPEKVPALIPVEPPVLVTPPATAPAKGLSPVSKVTGPITTRKKTGQIILTPTLVNPVEPRARLAPPLPNEARQEQIPSAAKPVDSPVTAKLPATPPPLPAAPATGLAPVTTPQRTTAISKVTGPIATREKQGPIILAQPLPSQTQPAPITESKAGDVVKAGETRPALRPAVLPNKMLVNPQPIETPAVPTAVKVVDKKSVTTSKVAESAAVAKPPATSPTPTAPAAKAPEPTPIPPEKKAPLPLTRAERAKRKRLVGTIVFYVFLVAIGVGLYFGGLYFGHETRIEGQVIPPPGMPLANEVWIVNDFRDSCVHMAEDLAADRTPALREIQYHLDHVQRAQADVTLREERIRLLQGQVQSCKDELATIGKQAREATQQIWDGPGAQLDAEYDARLNQLQKTIQEHAAALKLNYQPDDTYRSPEVWANAYRLALYQVPKGVDSAKEHQWLTDQMKQWRAFVKSQDAQKEQLREKAAQIKVAPGSKITDLDAKIDELEHRIDNTETEEEPIKAELQQAQTELARAQAYEAGLDDKYYQQLDGLPGVNIIRRIPLDAKGRFGWPEEESSFVEGEDEHYYWIFARAVRSDGREYWAMGRISVSKDTTHGWIIDPESFISTKAILRPNLSPDEQAQ